MLQARTTRTLVPKLLFALAVLLIISILTTKAPATSSENFQNSYFPTRLDSLRASIGGGNSLPSRLRRSEKLWKKSVEERRETFRELDRREQDMFPARDTSTYFAYPWTVWDFFPATYSCPHEIERVGRLGDGGKWTCGMSRYEETSSTRPCVVYSFGIQNESSYEAALLRRTKCRIYGYDFSVTEFGPSIKALPKEQQSRAHFKLAGIANEKIDLDRDPPFYTIRDLMKENGHEYVDIMKMDIEGSEFGAMDRLLESLEYDEPLPIGQFQVEIHLVRPAFPDFMRWWEALEEAGFRAVWTEPNLLQVTLRLEDGMPRYAEYTFINVRHPRNVLLCA